MAPNHCPAPPTFVASSQIDKAYKLQREEFSPALSNGKKINKKLGQGKRPLTPAPVKEYKIDPEYNYPWLYRQCFIFFDLLYYY